jgi:secreted trypsin-like serine protease
MHSMIFGTFAHWRRPGCVLAALTLLGGWPGSGQAVVRRDDVPLSSYASLGQSPQFQAVGMIEVNYGFGYMPFASATLIAKNYILCAGHVFDKYALGGAVGMRFILGGQTIPIQIKQAGVINIAPGYVNNPRTGALNNDISVVKLSQNSTVVPAAIYSGKSEKGKVGTMVGYGESGTGLTGDQDSTTKLGGHNTLDVVSKTTIETDFDSPHSTKQNDFGSATPTDLEGQLGPGDSGGALWIKVNGQWAMAGVNSFGEEGRGKLTFDGSGDPIEDYYGWISGFTRVSNYLSFIKKYVNVKVVSDTAATRTTLTDDAENATKAVSPRARTASMPGR